MSAMKFKLIQLWVRKLTVKPAFLTSADCECKARRIHLRCYEVFLSPHADSRVCRIQSDLLCCVDRIASLIRFISIGVKRAEMNFPLAFCVPSLGLPACFFIINVTRISCNDSISV